MVRLNKTHSGHGTRRAVSPGFPSRVGGGRTTRTLHELLDRIGDGSIAEIEDLEEEDVRLLQAYYGAEEELQALLDRLRVSGREEY